MEREPSYGYASHVGPLGLAVTATKGPVLELGMGYLSTHLLHWMCYPERELVSVEEDERWFTEFEDLVSPTHTCLHAPDWDRMYEKLAQPWGVVFIDSGRAVDEWIELRRKQVKLMFPWAEVLVAHDTNHAPLNDKELWEGYRHVWTFKPEGLPWTTVASQTVDLGELMHRAKVSWVPTDEP
jgi:hypothetical protein